jgi:hypothetical protein
MHAGYRHPLRWRLHGGLLQPLAECVVKSILQSQEKARAVAHMAIDVSKVRTRNLWAAREGGRRRRRVLGGMSQSDCFSEAFNVFVAVTEIEANVGVSGSRARGSFLTEPKMNLPHRVPICLGKSNCAGQKAEEEDHRLIPSFYSAFGRVRTQIHVEYAQLSQRKSIQDNTRYSGKSV